MVHLRWMVCPQPPHEQITVFVGQLVLDDEQCLVPLTVSVVLSVITDCPLQRPTIGDGEMSVLALLELGRVGLQRFDEGVEIDHRVLPDFNQKPVVLSSHCPLLLVDECSEIMLLVLILAYHPS